MLHALLLAPLLASALGQATPLGGTRIRVEILSLLEPQSVVIRSNQTAVALPNKQWLRPAGSLTVVRVRGLVEARDSDGTEWSGARLRVGGADTRFSLVVAGRQTIARDVRGELTIDVSERTLRIVVDTDLEALVASAVAAELDGVTDAAALEAASIAIRSYVVANRGRHASEGFDLCDTTHCLFSRGVIDTTNPAGDAASRAVEATRGVVLERDGHVVVGYLTACCGGTTTTPSATWGSKPSLDYEPVACAYCKSSPFFRWERSASADSVARALSPLAGWRLGADAAYELGGTDDHGWVRSVVIRSGGRSKRVTGDAFRMRLGRRLGWDTLPSSRFTIERVGPRVRFVGAGFGHGIGLCVAGAVERARRGASSSDILKAYFPNATTALLGVSGVR